MQRRSKRAARAQPSGAGSWGQPRPAPSSPAPARASPPAKSLQRVSTPCRCSERGCLIDGGIRIDTNGRSTSYGPGGAWYENGPEPVFAQAAADRPTRFIRLMVLPAACLGKSSLEYLNAEDKAKPKTQQYKVFADMPLRFATGR